MQTDIERLRELVKEIHAGQTRWDRKTPYYTHLFRVEEAVSKYVGEVPYLFDYQLVALAHDAAEDVKKWLNKEAELVDYIFEKINLENNPPSRKYHFVSTLRTLNKNNYDNYLSYILACKNHSLISLVVKMADIEDNLKDLTKGSMKEKYELALYILKN
jgi:hypothetical protein